MIIVVHNNHDLIRVEEYEKGKCTVLKEYQSYALNTILFELSSVYKESKIAWCLEKLYNNIDWERVDSLLELEMQFLTYNPSESAIFHDVIYYANFFSTTINNIPKNIRFQTWVMSEAVGVTHARLIQKFRHLSGKYNFQITLNAITKSGSAKGLLHYSEPLLYSQKTDILKQESLVDTLIFIKNFQGSKWLIYASILYLYKKKKNFFSILRAFFTKRDKHSVEDCLDLYESLNYLPIDKDDTIDVLIPTLGRKGCLKDVLDDLCHQTLLPKNVIIVEQHPDVNIQSELDYINTQKWPFEIKHSYIHQLGACNARNVGLKQLTSKWMFAADDDIRLKPEMIKDTISFMKTLSIGAVSIATYLASQEGKKFSTVPYLFDNFASGASIINQKFCRGLDFDMAYEFGYGEDTAYGCELRKRGCTVVYYPHNPILHLKASVGGLRFKFEHPWTKDKIQPKPSPSVMYFNKKYMNEEQIFGYKVFLFFSLLKTTKNFNLIAFSNKFKSQWDRSVYWADKKRGVK